MTDDAGHPEHVGLEDAFQTLSRMLLDEGSLEDTLTQVAALACRTVPPCGAASLTLLHDGRPSAEARTEPDDASLAGWAHPSGPGPCSEALESGKVLRLEVPTSELRWPQWSADAEADKMLSVLCVPLLVRDEPVASLHLFAKSPNRFSALDEEMARRFSEPAAVACANAGAYWRTFELNENLREAVATRDVIGQAKGILMARRSCTGDEAFDLLRRASQRQNLKLRDVAVQVVERGDLDVGLGGPPG